MKKIFFLLFLFPTSALADVVLTWSDVGAEDSYKIERVDKDCAVALDSEFWHLTSVPADTVTYTDTTVAEGAEVCYRVIPVKDGININGSNRWGGVHPVTTGPVTDLTGQFI